MERTLPSISFMSVSSSHGLTYSKRKKNMVNSVFPLNTGIKNFRVRVLEFKYFPYVKKNGWLGNESRLLFLLGSVFGQSLLTNLCCFRILQNKTYEINFGFNLIIPNQLLVVGLVALTSSSSDPNRSTSSSSSLLAGAPAAPDPFGKLLRRSPKLLMWLYLKADSMTKPGFKPGRLGNRNTC